MKKKRSLEEVIALVIENVIFFVAAIVLFLRTSELFSIFAPKNMIDAGYAPIYGWVSAALVEGLLVAVKFTLPHVKKAEAYAYNVLLIAVTFAISAAAQLADGYIIRDTLSRQSPAVQWLIQVGVPLVPSLILLAVAGRSIIENAPEGTAAIAAPKAARIPSKASEVSASVQYAAESGGVTLRRNELSAADWEYIAGHNSAAVMARYGVSGRTARDWRQAAKRGETR